MNNTVNTNRRTRIYIFALPASLLVIAVYVWLISPGSKRPGTSFYSQLAIGFRHGQLHLTERPSAALLSLSDPYDYTLRKDSNVEDFPWDASLYDGKFFIYWGPVPALLLTPFSDRALSRTGDEYLVFIFLLGLFVYSALFIKDIWLESDINLPGWMIAPAMLAIGLYSPVTLMLGNPKIYEAAIAGCQFFFIGGCYWAYAAIRKQDPRSFWMLGLAGLHWAFAIGTRLTILPVIAFVGAATLMYMFQKDKTEGDNKMLFVVIAMGMPLLASAAALGWYNWARFGSIFEFGMRFQLASVNYSQFNELFSARYAYGNFTSYFLQPYRIQDSFPFIRTVENPVTNDRFAGLLFTSPCILAAFLLPVRSLFSKTSGSDQGRWLTIVFAGSSLISLVIILCYYFTAIRFTADFMPSLMLLAMIGLAQKNDLSTQDKKKNIVHLIFTLFLTVVTITTSALIAIPTGRANLLLKYIEKLLN